MITFYDIPSKLEGKVFSPNTLKTRITLNYKGLPFKTEWVEMPDIESVIQNIGGSPTDKKGGRDYYTLPAIFDSTTGKVVTESANIAVYLDETYPDTPAIFPILGDGEGALNTRAAISAFRNLFLQKFSPIFNVGVTASQMALNPRSADHIRRTRKPLYGKRIEDLAPPGPERDAMWREFKEGMEYIADLLDQNNQNGSDKLFLFGETFSFADAVALGLILWLMRVIGQESDEWKEVERWSGGRWKSNATIQPYSAALANSKKFTDTHRLVIQVAMITFYDIASKLDNQSWSPSTLRARVALNYKGVPYKTEWVEMPDIAPKLKEIGGAPTKKKDSQDFYTLPAIHDSDTGRVITESTNIAAYLDEKYPDRPLLFPKEIETRAAVSAFISLYIQKWTPILLPAAAGTYELLLPRSAEYFRQTRESWFGKKVEEFAPPGPERDAMWESLKEGLGQISDLLGQNDKSEEGLFLFGDVFSFADVTVVSFLLWLKTVSGPSGDEWEAVEGWHGGRWARLLEKTSHLHGSSPNVD